MNQKLTVNFSDFPFTLRQCVEKLKVEIPAESLEQLRVMAEDDLILCHFGLALYIRNKWLHVNNSLTQRSFSRVGMSEPDTSSNLIVEALWRDLNELPVDFAWLSAFFGVRKTSENFSKSDTWATAIKILLG